MLTDAHCHPYDLFRLFPRAEEERRRLGVIAAASACDFEEFGYNEKLALQAAAEKAAPLLLCFAIHPQMLKNRSEQNYDELFAAIFKAAQEKRLAAIGECGFDLYNTAFKETEALQDKIFAAHLEAAIKFDIPVVLHVRRAMHKIFAYSKTLKKCKAVVFHSWPGAFEEGQALLGRGVNAYFSFAGAILNGHKQAVRCCSLFPADRLLTETDAPFQPIRGEDFSSWSSLSRILEAAAALRGVSVEELEAQIEKNFRKILCPQIQG